MYHTGKVVEGSQIREGGGEECPEQKGETIK